MIPLAVNDTPLSRRLLEEGRLVADYLETSGPHVDSAVEALPHARFLLHNAVWDWSLAHPDALGQQDVLPLTTQRLRRTRAPWLSVHIGFSAASVAYREGMRPTSAPLARAELLATMTRNVHALADRLDVPLLLENLDFNATGAYDHVCDPSFIRALVEDTGTSLLLDLAHAQVSADRLDMDVPSYLNALPLARLRQVHVSGPRVLDGVLHDAHEPLRDRDMDLLREVLTAGSPWAVTLEYGREERSLLAQVEALREVLGETRSAPGRGGTGA